MAQIAPAGISRRFDPITSRFATLGSSVMLWDPSRDMSSTCVPIMAPVPEPDEPDEVEEPEDAEDPDEALEPGEAEESAGAVEPVETEPEPSFAVRVGAVVCWSGSMLQALEAMSVPPTRSAVTNRHWMDVRIGRFPGGRRPGGGLRACTNARARMPLPRQRRGQWLSWPPLRSRCPECPRQIGRFGRGDRAIRSWCSGVSRRLISRDARHRAACTSL